MRLLEFFRPFRVIISRRVSEEEQVSIEAFAKTSTEAQIISSEVLSCMRDHRKKSNDEVVAVTRAQLAGLDTAIQVRGAEAQRLDEELVRLRGEVSKYDDLLKAKKRRLGIDVVPSPKPNGAA